MDTQMKTTSSIGLVSALIIDDSLFDRRRFLRIAEETSLDFFIKEAGSIQEFGSQLDKDKFDVIYVDLNLGVGNGMALLPTVRKHKVNKDAALIMVAGDSHSETALTAIRQGFADYIEKDALSAASLERATVNALQKAKLSQAAVLARADASMVEDVLSTFAHACNKEMRPLMARMIRQLRELKSITSENGAADIFRGIETTCARIDEFFVDISALRDEGDLSQLVGTDPQNTAATATLPDALVMPPPNQDGEQAPRTERPTRRKSLFSQATQP